MSFKQFIVIPIIIAVLACIMQAIDQWLAGNTVVGKLLAGGGSWIAFQAWACYFLGGCNVRGGVKAFLAYFIGIAASIFIMKLGGTLAGAGLGFWAVPIAVLIVVVPCICCERVELLDYLPALFVGAGAYFGIMGYISGSPAVSPEFVGNFYAFGAVELFYCTFGLVWGYITVTLRVAYEKSLAQTSKA